MTIMTFARPDNGRRFPLPVRPAGDHMLYSLTVRDGLSGDVYFNTGGSMLACRGILTPRAPAILEQAVAAGTRFAARTNIWLSIGATGCRTFANIQATLQRCSPAATHLIDNLTAIASFVQHASDRVGSVGFDLDNADIPLEAVVPLIGALYAAGLALPRPVVYPFIFTSFAPSRTATAPCLRPRQ